MCHPTVSLRQFYHIASKSATSQKIILRMRPVVFAKVVWPALAGPASKYHDQELVMVEDHWPDYPLDELPFEWLRDRGDYKILSCMNKLSRE